MRAVCYYCKKGHMAWGQMGDKSRVCVRLLRHWRCKRAGPAPAGAHRTAALHAWQRGARRDAKQRVRVGGVRGGAGGCLEAGAVRGAGDQPMGRRASAFRAENAAGRGGGNACPRSEVEQTKALPGQQREKQGTALEKTGGGWELGVHVYVQGGRRRRRGPFGSGLGISKSEESGNRHVV